MPTYLKTGFNTLARAAEDAQVRIAVEAMLLDIEQRGDTAVRELSTKFDGWARQDYRLTAAEIAVCMNELSAENISDIKFAQAQDGNFAEHQRAAISDVEVETMIGIVLGHRNVPTNAVGCYVPGGKYPPGMTPENEGAEKRKCPCLATTCQNDHRENLAKAGYCLLRHIGPICGPGTLPHFPVAPRRDLARKRITKVRF